MTVQVRLTRKLYESIRSDLERAHSFAAERVGFASVRQGSVGDDELLVLLSEYFPVPDNQYINDPLSGARIDSAAIRAAMQRVLDQGCGMFHVHMHLGNGKPRFSRMDLEELPRLVASFRGVGQKTPHGLLLLNQDNAAAVVWLPGKKEPLEATCISVVGYPLRFFGG